MTNELAIRILTGTVLGTTEQTQEAVTMAVRALLQPERKKGHWVVDEDGNIECSECGHSGVGDYYCERCGADMREEKDDETN